MEPDSPKPDSSAGLRPVLKLWKYNGETWLDSGWKGDYGYVAGLAAYKDDLYLLYVQDEYQYLMWDIYEKRTGKWRGGEKVLIQKKDPIIVSDRNSALAHANGYLYFVHGLSNRDHRLCWTRYDPGNGWSEDKPVIDANRSAVISPFVSITVYYGLLYCSYIDSGEQGIKTMLITHDTVNGKWGIPEPAQFGTEAYAANITKFNDLHFMWHEHTRENIVWTRSYNNKRPNHWSEAKPIKDNKGNWIKSSGNPTIAACNDFLFCVTSQRYPSVFQWTCSKDGGIKWTPPQILPPKLGNNDRSAMTPYDGLLYVAITPG